MTGDRLSTLTDPEREKLAAALLLLSPGVPLLFMGQEYGERRPFLYFVDHGDPDLVNAVREGRKREFAEFHMEGEPPDAFSKETFNQSKLSWDTGLEPHSSILAVYCNLIGLRRESAALRGTARTQIEVSKLENEPVIVLVRENEGRKVAALFHFSDTAVEIPLPVKGQWSVVLDTAEKKFGGPGAARPELLTQNEQVTMHPWSALVLSREDTDTMPDLCQSSG
jgi:maltooligosyltrehalose trehalohydrolase